MRRALVIITIGLLAGAGGVVEAKERPLTELPRDVWDLALAWTEPAKQVARETRRFDPVSGLWFGLLEGSVRSLELTADFLLPGDSKTSQGPSPSINSGKALWRYSF